MALEYKYRIDLEVDTGSFFKPANDIVDSLNESMASFGFHEKLVLRSTIPWDVTCNRPLVKQEIDKLTELLQENCDKMNPEWHAKVKSVQRIDRNRAPQPQIEL